MPPSRVSPPPTTTLFTPSRGLTPEQLSTFHRDGYLILPAHLDPSQTSDLLSETSHLLQTFPLASHPLTKFSTGESEAHVGDTYFLESHDKIRYFFEEDAFLPSGELAKPKHLAINKIGHYLHALSPPFKVATLTERNAAIARSLGFRDPRVLQSMVICKQPEIGGRVPPHQDSTFLYTDPPSAVGFWIALEDATVRNGCLSFLRGSHRRAPVRKRFVRVAEGGTGFEDVTGSSWSRDVEEWRESNDKSNKDKDLELDENEECYELGDVQAGSLVLIHGNLLHKSERNTSLRGRMIYTFHVIEGQEMYDEKNWLQPPEGGFTRLYDEHSLKA